MKKLPIIVMTFSLLLIPFMAYGQPAQTSTQAPPVAPALVREGDFAMKLVSVLKIGTASSEAEAETILGSSGIAPKNGWIGDYPVTPDIIGDLQNAVSAAADSNSLPMGKDEALETLQNLTVELGLNIVADTSGQYSENQAPTSPQYTEPAVVNNYYYEEGPPVVTYYPPPPDYYYLYAWVPSPFWCSSFFFPGFFILHDFHRVIIVNGHHRHHGVVIVSNHVINSVTKTVVVIDPPARNSGKTVSAVSKLPTQQGFTSTTAEKGASSILNRSIQRTTTTGGEKGKNFDSTMPGGTSGKQQIVTNRGGNTSTPRGNMGVVVNPLTTSGKTGTNQSQTGRHEMENRTFNQPSNIDRRNEMSLQGPSGGQSKSLPAPNVTHERSFSPSSMSGRGFNGPSGSSGRPSSTPSRSLNAPRSFSTPSAPRSLSTPSRSFSPPSMGSRGSFGGFHSDGGSHGGFVGRR